MQSSFKLNFCEGKTMIFEKSASNYQMDFVNFYFLNLINRAQSITTYYLVFKSSKYSYK